MAKPDKFDALCEALRGVLPPGGGAAVRRVQQARVNKTHAVLCDEMRAVLDGLPLNAPGLRDKANTLLDAHK